MYWSLDTTLLPRTQRETRPPPCANLACKRGFSTRHALKHREHALLLSCMKLYCLSSFAVFALLAFVFKTRKSRACNCSMCPLSLGFGIAGYARFVLCPLLIIGFPVNKLNLTWCYWSYLHTVLSSHAECCVDYLFHRTINVHIKL